MSSFTESVVEEAALACLEDRGYSVLHGLDISPGSDALTLFLFQQERTSYSASLRDALPDLPSEALRRRVHEADANRA